MSSDGSVATTIRGAGPDSGDGPGISPAQLANFTAMAFTGVGRLLVGFHDPLKSIDVYQHGPPYKKYLPIQGSNTIKNGVFTTRFRLEFSIGRNTGVPEIETSNAGSSR
jgi:hypothetical protein